MPLALVLVLSLDQLLYHFKGLINLLDQPLNHFKGLLQLF